MSNIDISNNKKKYKNARLNKLNDQNKLDLIYLTNGINLDKILLEKNDTMSKEYLEKYKEIILTKTKEMIDLSCNYSKNLYYSFKSYVNVIVDEYEFNKKKDLIQKRYVGFKKNDEAPKKEKIDLDIGLLDVTILKKKEKKSTLHSFIKKKKKKVKKIVYPKKISFKK